MTVISKRLVVQAGTPLEAAVGVASHFDKNHVLATEPKKLGANNFAHYEVEGQSYKAYHTDKTINVALIVETKEEAASDANLSDPA